MTIYTTSDLSRRSGDIIADALKAPVTLTQRKKPRLVVLRVELFNELCQRASTRKAGKVDTMPAGLADEFRAAIAAYNRDDSE